MLIMLWVHVKCGCACTFTCATSGLDIEKYAPGGSTLEMGELTFVLVIAGLQKQQEQSGNCLQRHPRLSAG